MEMTPIPTITSLPVNTKQLGRPVTRAVNILFKSEKNKLERQDILKCICTDEMTQIIPRLMSADLPKFTRSLELVLQPEIDNISSIDILKVTTPEAMMNFSLTTFTGTQIALRWR